MMKELFDFISAAAPWVIMGIALAIFFGRSAVKKKKRNGQNKKHSGDYSAEGMSLGMCFGVAIGTALDNISMGLSLGMLLGMAIGSCIQKDEEDPDE